MQPLWVGVEMSSADELAPGRVLGHRGAVLVELPARALLIKAQASGRVLLRSYEMLLLGLPVSFALPQRLLQRQPDQPPPAQAKAGVGQRYRQQRGIWHTVSIVCRSVASALGGLDVGEEVHRSAVFDVEVADLVIVAGQRALQVAKPRQTGGAAERCEVRIVGWLREGCDAAQPAHVQQPDIAYLTGLIECVALQPARRAQRGELHFDSEALATWPPSQHISTLASFNDHLHLDQGVRVAFAQPAPHGEFHRLVGRTIRLAIAIEARRVAGVGEVGAADRTVPVEHTLAAIGTVEQTIAR